MKKYEEETKKLYNSISSVWPENNLWYDYTHEKIINFIESNKNIYSQSSKILNAGSGGQTYNLLGEFYHVDIAESLINDLPNSFVTTIESMSFDTGFFDISICVNIPPKNEHHHRSH